MIESDSLLPKSSHHHHGHASLRETVLNIMKSCMGTGCLALPFACQQGGIVLYTLGVACIALWNVYAVERLCRCWELTATASTTTLLPPHGTTQLGTVTWYAFGRRGVWALEMLLLVFFMGVLVAYLAAVDDFLRDTPFYQRGVVSLLTGLGMVLLSLVQDMGDLSRISALGLIVLASSCLLVALVGIQQSLLLQQPLSPSSLQLLNWWPDSHRGWSHCFGIVVIGYGVVPLTYNLRDSMAEPRRMVEATSLALSAVFAFYVLLGLGLYYLFPNVQGELLQQLGNGLVPVLTRLAMAGVVLLTAPLLLVPCSELVEGKLFSSREQRSQQHMYVVRFGMGAIAAGIAILVPSFVDALALVGCACVGVLGLCLPPLLHLKLTPQAPFSVRCLDGMCLLCGGVATVVSTLYAVGAL